MPEPATVTQADLVAAQAAFKTAKAAYVDIRDRLLGGAPVELGELDCRASYSGFYGLKIVQAKTTLRDRDHK